MPRKKDVVVPSQTELMLARSLFRADKWDPERDPARPFEWDDLRLMYIRRAGRLMRTFEKDGLRLSEAPTPPAAAVPAAQMGAGRA